MNKASLFENTLRKQLGQVIFGLDATLHGISIALLAQGHTLLEGAPGLGKTLLAKSLASLLGGKFGRIQGTADLMPSDITGIHIYNNQSQQFEFQPGPLFNEVVLMDEINRTGPKTQSALLQAMEEYNITVDRKTYALAEDFFIIATQNPFEFEGVFPLPESQVDRFLIRLELDYPETATEVSILQHYDNPGSGHAENLPAIAPMPDTLLGDARAEIQQIHVAQSLYHYVVSIAATSRKHPDLSLGLSPRGALALMRCAKVEAALAERHFVTPDDVKTVAPMVVAHRLQPTAEAQLQGTNAIQIFQDIIAQIPVPREPEQA